MSASAVYFGGPDCQPGCLRDLLSERVASVPTGGFIHWVSYYFRDRRLAAELIRARHRGVRVTVVLEGRPRTPHANDAVVRMLGAPEGLGAGLRLTGRRPLDVLLRPRLHEKLYCFSHPRLVALIGSFNPSGDLPEQSPEVVDEIGDQDRGFNDLVEISDPEVVRNLVEHARDLHRRGNNALDRFRPAANRPLRGEDLEIHFWPRVAPNPVDRLLLGFGPGTRVRIACSHLSGITSRRTLRRLVRQGVAVEVLSEWTRRRVPRHTEALLTAQGIPFRRIGEAHRLPMHYKFILVDRPGERWVVFGSSNWSERSRRINREIAAVSRNDLKLFDAFSERWDSLAEREPAPADAV